MRIPAFRASRPAAGLLLFSVLILLQAGCRPVREATPGPAGRPPPVSQEIPPGFTRYTVVSAESEVRVLVYRDGPMARLGHNHVFCSRSLRGEVLAGEKGLEPRVTLLLPVASFSVDQADLRAEEGEDFPGVVADDAIAGTRKNMLSEALLDGARFPDIRLTSRRIAGSAPDHTVTVAVEVKGQTREIRVPVRVEQLAKELRASGTFTVTHGQLGLTPFTVMGGLLSVRDGIRVRFRIVARPSPT